MYSSSDGISYACSESKARKVTLLGNYQHAPDWSIDLCAQLSTLVASLELEPQSSVY